MPIGNDDAGDAGGTSFRERLLQDCKDDRFVASRGALVGSFIFNASECSNSVDDNHCNYVFNAYSLSG